MIETILKSIQFINCLMLFVIAVYYFFDDGGVDNE